MTKIKVSPLVFVFAVAMFLTGNGFVLAGYTVCVVMHEMAHAEAARRRGFVLDNIKIMPYGASLTGEFAGAGWRDEFFIALAGPLSNIFAAVVFTSLWWLVPATYFFTEDFVLANIFTALTNLLPIFPLDGGRAVLAIMSRKVPRQKAYKALRIFGVAAGAGFLCLFAVSLFVKINLTFALMAFFVLSGTFFPDKQSKYQRLYSLAYRSEKLKRGLTVREIMVSDKLTLHDLNKMLNGNYFVRFSVVDEKMSLVGTVTETRLEKCLTAFPHSTRLSDLPRAYFE